MRGDSTRGAGDLAGSLADLLLGSRCAACGEPGRPVCAACAALVNARPPFLVGLPSTAPAAVPVYAGGDYDGVLRALLLAAKERNALALLPVLAGRLAAALAAWAIAGETATGVLLVPVPTAASRVAERGVDLPSALAAAASRRLRAAGLPVRTWRGLRLARRPADQSELGRRERLTNLAGAFRIGAAPPPGRLVVVDDIVTTGATLAEAVRACALAGRPVAAAATVAATRRRTPPA